MQFNSKNIFEKTRPTAAQSGQFHICLVQLRDLHYYNIDANSMKTVMISRHNF